MGRTMLAQYLCGGDTHENRNQLFGHYHIVIEE
jgi:hypothetical protein